MSLINKKYFSIKEVSRITGIPSHKLRYLEKTSSKMEIFQIRGRRYYTKDDIKTLVEKNGKATGENFLPLIQTSVSSLNMPESKLGNITLSINNNLDQHLIGKIDSLITKFITIEKNIFLILEKFDSR